MPRPVALLFLILALTGQPLRQAEAASDFSRILGHLLAANITIETPDGGVGDDSGVAVMKADTSHTASSTWSHDQSDLWAFSDSVSSFLLRVSSSPGLCLAPCWQEHVPWLPMRASQRQAWLQLLQV